MILIVNLGSTSLKYQLYDTDNSECRLKIQRSIDQSPNWVEIWQFILVTCNQNEIKVESIKTVLHRVVFAPIDVLQSQDTNLFEVRDLPHNNIVIS